MAYRVTTIGGIGDAGPAPVGASIDPAKKAQLLDLAASMPDDRASDLADIVDATPYGHRQKWIRYGLGALAGAALGVFVLTPIVGLVTAGHTRKYKRQRDVAERLAGYGKSRSGRN